MKFKIAVAKHIGHWGWGGEGESFKTARFKNAQGKSMRKCSEMNLKFPEWNGIQGPYRNSTSRIWAGIRSGQSTYTLWRKTRNVVYLEQHFTTWGAQEKELPFSHSDTWVPSSEILSSVWSGAWGSQMFKRPLLQQDSHLDFQSLKASRRDWWVSRKLFFQGNNLKTGHKRQG